MPKLYHVKTGNFLPSTKRCFKCFEDAIQHLKKIVDMKEDWVTDAYVHRSYKVIKIDSEELHNWPAIFKVNKTVGKVMPPNKKELHNYKTRMNKKNAQKH